MANQFYPGVYHAGAMAFLDAFTSGLVPCRVIEVIESGPGNRVCAGKVRVRVMEDHNGYHKGEILVKTAHSVIPRDRIVYRGIYLRINTQYEWQ